MLINLENARESKKITLAQIGALLGVRYQTVSDKIRGVSGFSFDEAVKIRRTFFPEYDLEYLFAKE
ncbi:helix-turn-helix domain-containing protein [Turicibacter sanguinis]|nr:helix-turn-helix domain-containing protein [Turicibacter sanguinis]